MKISVKKLKRLISESVRMQLTDLMDLQDRLDDALVTDQITQRMYDKEWNEILAAAGYTPEEYENEIDRRWGYIDSTRDVPVHARDYGPN